MRLMGGVVAAGGTLSRLSPCEAANDGRRLRPSTFWGIGLSRSSLPTGGGGDGIHVGPLGTAPSRC